MKGGWGWGGEMRKEGGGGWRDNEEKGVGMER